MLDLKEGLKQNYLIGNRPVNWQILDLKSKEKAYLSVKKYHKAEMTRWKWQQMEEEDLQMFMEIEFKQIL